MSHHQLLTLFVFVMCLGFCQAQNMDDFSGLKPQSPLPKAISSSSAKKYKVLKAEMEVEKISTLKRKSKQKFHLENTYFLDEMIKSGVVLFNDPISEYVGQVADKLLEHDPSLRKKLKFYTVRSPEVNASATSRGEIFLNLGLLSRLETEAQLAFVLAHEIIHVKERHSMETFLEFEGIGDDKRFKKKNDYSQLLYKSNYSKRIEKEADGDGLELFLKSDYATGNIEGVFDILATGHMSFNNSPFDFSYLKINNLHFPDSILLDSVNVVESYEEDQKHSTHPGVKLRRKAINDALVKAGDDGTGEDFLVGEVAFKKARMLARFECCNILVENTSYIKALYLLEVLSNDYPNNTFLEKTKMKAIYGLAKMGRKYGFSPLEEAAKEAQGEIQQVYHFVCQLSKSDAGALAAAHLWEYCQKYPNDEVMKLRLQDILTEIGEEDEDLMAGFYGEETEDSLLTKGIFANYKDNPTFKSMLEDGSDVDSHYVEMDEETFLNKVEKGFRLGLDEVTFINPYYIRVNMKKKKQPVQFLESEDRQGKMVEMIKKNGERLDVKTDFMDLNSLKKKSTAEDFMEIITMENWMEQQLTFPDMIPHNHEEAMAIIKAKGIKNVAFVGSFSIRFKKDKLSKLGNVLVASTGLFTPVGLYMGFRPKNKSLYYALVVNVESQKVLMSTYNVVPTKDRASVMDSNLYWLLLQIKTPPKK